MRIAIAFASLLAMTGWVSATPVLFISPNPETSPLYPAGTSFEPGEVGTITYGPDGPFLNSPVEFEGYDAGGSTLTLSGVGTCGGSNPCLVSSYNLLFGSPAEILSVSITGDALNGAVFELVNSSGLVVDSLTANTGNLGHTETFTLPVNLQESAGASLSLNLYDDSGYWTYVSAESVNLKLPTATPEPAEAAMLLVGLGAMGIGAIGSKRWR